MKLSVTFSGPDLGRIVQALDGAGVLSRRAPSWGRVGSDTVALTGAWAQKAAELASTTDLQQTHDDGSLLAVRRGKVVRFDRPGHLPTLEAVLSLLDQIPFDIASFPSVFPGWNRGEPAPPPAGFGNGHPLHGWAAAFRDAGHEQLVSRRWLEYGPWLLHRSDREDVSLVQFHSLDASPAEAIAQVAESHQRLGYHEAGGLLHRDLGARAPGDYVYGRRTLEIPVYGEPVSPEAMLIARTIQRRQALGPQRPVERVLFAFADEREARAHVHQLWLRELGCLVRSGAGAPRDLTSEYDPGPRPRPFWA